MFQNKNLHEDVDLEEYDVEDSEDLEYPTLPLPLPLPLLIPL